MMPLLNILNGGSVQLTEGLPSHLAPHRVPEAAAWHHQGRYGTICLQQLATPNYLFRHFLFSLNQELCIQVDEVGQPFQSLLSSSGVFLHQMPGTPPVLFKSKEFLLFGTAGEESSIKIFPSQLSSLVNVHYLPSAYLQFVNLFERLTNDLRKAFAKPYYFQLPPRIAKHSVHDTIQAIWLDKYLPSLQQKHVELRLEAKLFTLLAQTYANVSTDTASQLEQQKAAEAHDIILRDIRKHLTPEQIAASLHCSTSWLKKAFSKVYGIGMFHFLRKTRMERAKEMLLRGDSLKAVAIEVGMKPRNFPKEFKAHFGYTVTALKKGEV